MNFKELHQQTHPLLICNVWDVPSAKAAQKLQFQAIGTSSGAVSSLLGYSDGEEIPFEELELIVKRITHNVKIPLSVDIEGGYSRNPEQVSAHIRRLADLGVVGVNLEDSVVEDGVRTLLDAAQFKQFLEKVCTQIQDTGVFINARTDTYIQNCPNTLEETLVRGNLYQNAGANGLFVPCIVQKEDIEALVQGVALPLNVMAMPKLPDFNALQALGVKRISMGNFVFLQAHKLLKKELEYIKEDSSFVRLFSMS